MPILPGTDGVRRMGKSLGNYIAIEDTPTDMFGKVMSLPDNVIALYFELLTDIPDAEVEEIRTAIETHSTNPMAFKKRLGVELVAWFHSVEEGEGARDEFERVFQQREQPADVPEFVVTAATEGVSGLTSSGFTADLSRLLVAAGLAPSRGEARRLLQQNAVEIDGARVSDTTAVLLFDTVVRAGRRRFIRVVRGQA
jgi:tyrosyl-tRNA synthetase